MDEEPPSKPADEFSRRVGAKATRKLKAQRQAVRSVWSGLGMFGLVGWSVVVPALLGAMAGIWLDRRYPGKHSWTLTLLITGLILGCLNAWHWVSRENKHIHEEDKEDQDE